jgi:hypothetical protein
MKMAVFWVETPCRLVQIYQCFRGPYCLHHQGPWWLTAIFILTAVRTAYNIWQSSRIYICWHSTSKWLAYWQIKGSSVMDLDSGAQNYLHVCATEQSGTDSHYVCVKPLWSSLHIGYNTIATCWSLQTSESFAGNYWTVCRYGRNNFLTATGNMARNVTAACICVLTSDLMKNSVRKASQTQKNFGNLHDALEWSVRFVIISRKWRRIKKWF